VKSLKLACLLSVYRQETNAFIASGTVAQGWSASLEAWAETKGRKKDDALETRIRGKAGL
jgi:hypothetical protein